MIPKMELTPEICGRASRQGRNDLPSQQREILAVSLVQTGIVFLVSYLLLFYGMSRRPGTYDEGIALTGAMRVAAGQIPHRDFYFIYGPAEVYMLAGLFKVFGPSLLVERLFDLLIKALLVASIYAIVSSYCRRSIAIFASVVTIVWLFGAGAFALAITPVSLLNLIGSALLLPIFVSKVSTRRMLAAGAVSGAASLFRYDTGIALLIIHACVISIAVCLRSEGTANKLRTFASTFWPYLLGFARSRRSTIFMLHRWAPYSTTSFSTPASIIIAAAIFPSRAFICEVWRTWEFTYPSRLPACHSTPW
jgi:hypothetical protein